MPYRDQESLPKGRYRCPRCKQGLMSQPIGSVPVHRCSTCQGVWVQASVFNELFIEAGRQREVLRHEPPRLAPRDSGAELRCPVCRGAMARRNFGRISGILVDACKRHGIWFDAGELRLVVEFLERKASQEGEDVDLAAPARESTPLPVPPALDISLLIPSEESLFERLLTRISAIVSVHVERRRGF